MVVVWSDTLNTCGRGAGTHGDVLNVHTGRGGKGGSSPVLLTKFCPRRVSTCPRGSTKKPVDVTYFQFENRSRTTRCRVLHLFASPEHTVQLQTHDTTTHTDTHKRNTTTYSNTQQHSTAQHNTPHRSEEKRRKDERNEERQRRKGIQMRREREREKREIGRETRGEREERVLTCIRGSPIVSLRILPTQRFESWSRTTPARIL